MPYLMGGFPDDDASRAIGAASPTAGADLVELGVPFSDPLADGPVIHAAGHAGARARAPRCTPCSSVARALAERRAGGGHVLREPRLARGVERFAASSPRAGVSGLIIPDLPLEEAPARRSPPATRPASRSSRSSRRRRRRSAWRDRRPGPRLPLHGLGHRHDRRARRRDGELRRPPGAREGRAPTSRSRSASGSRRRRRGRRGATQGPTA